MTDKQIIGLFFDRDEAAISGISEKYGDYCFTVAKRVLHDFRDSEEVINDTWLAIWKKIPPEKPSDLKAYAGRIARNLAVDKFRRSQAAKRVGEAGYITDELDECAAGSPGADEECFSKELSLAVNRFVEKLPKKDRGMFVARYSLSYPVAEIAEAFGCSDNYVRAVLSEVRKKLKKHLEKEGLL